MRLSTSCADVDHPVDMFEINESLEGILSLLWVLLGCGTVFLFNGQEETIEEIDFYIPDSVIDTHLEIFPHL